jgi:GNAT superfamily N-acetyltransferase
VSYQRFYDAGVLCVVGCFSDSILVGYGVVIKLPELWGLGGFVADVVSIYLLPEYRKGLNGFRLIRFVENAARVLECKEIKVSVSRRSKDKLGRPRTNLFAKLGYSFREAVLVKRL